MRSRPSGSTRIRYGRRFDLALSPGIATPTYPYPSAETIPGGGARRHHRRRHGSPYGLRKAFAAVHDLLKVHAQLPEGHSLGDSARAALAALFPEGTGFLTSGASELDVACGRVLQRARHPKVEKALRTLGCNPHMKAAKAAYGAFVTAREASVEAPVVKSSSDNAAIYNDAIDALREYARLVEAYALLEGASLDRVLLAPLAHKRMARQRPKAIAPEPTESDRIDEAPPSRAA